MKPFWRSFLASALAVFIIGIILVFIFLSGISRIFSGFSDDKVFKVEENSVLHMTLDGPISEVSYTEFDQSALSINQGMGLREIKKGLEVAKTDDKIEGILLNLTSVPAGMATTEEIRNAIIDFKSSGKFVIAYSEVYSQKAYYLSTVADEVYLYPEGMAEFKGLGAELMFLKGAIDKLGVDVQIIRGSNNKFKSAVEPLMYDSMSVANREQTMTYLNAMWDQMLSGINATRGISKADLNEMADSMYVRSADAALEYKLVDGLIYEDELLSKLRSKAGTEEEEDLQLVSFCKYAAKKSREADREINEEDENIAVVYAVGGIESGKGNATTIGSETIAKAIRDARENDNIKAIVLRINSPGGSALASDVIWREVTLCKKPIIVSMSDVAASGGYYIACAADKIYAHPNTITGSIGVFGIIPNFGPMFKDKLGITFDRAQTNYHSVLSVNKALTDEEKKLIQEGVDDIYDDFTQKVADGRDGLEQADVDSIGQGRVWAGTDAMEIGLVDELGGIDDAIEYAAEQANVSDVVIGVYPKKEKSPLEEILEAIEIAEDGAEQESTTAKAMELIKTVDRMVSMQGVQARLPYEITIE